MEGFVRAQVPGLEDEYAPEGTARAIAIGAANHWHQRFLEVEKAHADLMAADNVSRLGWFMLGVFSSLVGVIVVSVLRVVLK